MGAGKSNTVIVAKFNARQIAERLKTSVDDAIDRILVQLQYIGEECIKAARENGNYNDITGNLRSSIGYIVLYNGSTVTQSITTPTTVSPGYRTVTRTNAKGKTVNVKQKIGGDGGQGNRAAQKLLSRLKSEYPRGCVLIVCAGMEYAAYVENVHGKRVLVDAKLCAKRLVEKLFARK